MRRRRADTHPKTPLLNDATASGKTVVAPGLGRGAPPPPAPPAPDARIFVYRMMLAGASREKIAEMGNLHEPRFGRELVFRLYSEICHELGDAASLPEHAREYLRAQQVERLRNELVDIRMRRIGLNRQQHAEYVAMTREIRQIEGLLADIEGTRSPVELDVTVDMDVRVRSASLRIVQNMTAEDFARIGREMAGRG